MRAMFAGHSFELVGCDVMHNADKFARFPCTKKTIDCRIKVTVQEDRLPSLTDPICQVGDWRCYPCDGGKRFLHRTRTMMIATDEHFTDVHLTLSSAMPQMETMLYLQVQQMIGCYLLLHGGALIHSAGLSLAGNGVLLGGRMGVGKSTMARHLQTIAPQVTVLSEDMPAVMMRKGGFRLCGTPLCGGDPQCENADAPLTYAVLLRQATVNRFVTPTADEAVYELLGIVPRTVYATDAAVAATEQIMAMVQQVPIVIFENDGTQEAARLLLHYIQNRGNIDED